MSHENLNIFGVPASKNDSLIWLYPVPWEVTTSYGGGTADGPNAILEASPQIDLFDSDFSDAYKAGYYMFAEDSTLRKSNEKHKAIAQKVIKEYEKTGSIEKSQPLIDQVNTASQEMVDHVYSWAKTAIAEKHLPAVVGGDHSTPLGLIQALCETHKDLGILHIDAHADLRKSYQGFHHSHASIMRNVCELATPPQKLVQVAIRDFCLEEYEFIQANERKIKTFFDREIKSAIFSGTTWDQMCEKIVRELPEKVYVSFDIDGLSPEFCPHTGTPVPGGLNFDQANHLLSVLHRANKHIVGFDLNEVAPAPDSEWDGNVGSRVLFKLCGWAASGHQKQGRI